VKKVKILCFDLDNTLCVTKGNNYLDAKPNQKNIDVVNQLYAKGFIIKIFTSRFMGRSKENIQIAKRRGFLITTKQLKKWKISYHKLIMGKPSYDLIIDDKSLGYNKNWAVKIKKKYL
jgi:hypothetical protein